MFVTPQTDDGRVTSVEPGSGACLTIEVEFTLSQHFRDMIAGRISEVTFASRSRLARLGIDVRPVDWEVDNKRVRMSALVESLVAAYGVEQYLPELILPGLRIGRLVFCPNEGRLTTEQIYAEVLAHSLQLPASFSIDQDGHFSIQSHRIVYDLVTPVTLEELRTILTRDEGQDLLNRKQVGRSVPHILLKPGDGVITSCSMFLHRHYVVIDREASRLGQHLQAVVLDPVSTRGANVFLEYCNYSDTPIVNPAVTGTIYRASPIAESQSTWRSLRSSDDTDELAAARDYERLVAVFDSIKGDDARAHSDRSVALIKDFPSQLDGGLLAAKGSRGTSPPLTYVVSRSQREQGQQHSGIKIFRDLAQASRATLLLNYFPDLYEHLDICSAGLEGKVSRIVFRHASTDHGMFLSARDHARLADYDAIGIEVDWCNDTRGHVATHCYRGRRGYFMEPRTVDAFRSRLILAFYGSSQPLSDLARAKLKQLLVSLKEFFGDSIAILTGGGPGAMRQASDIAHEIGIVAGANFIETVDQGTNHTVDFYQTFQGRSRHSRQRWFEIASFHLFAVGGVGTLEEIGLTLTDMKLGVIGLSPLVFFGAHGDDPYWYHLQEQLNTMVMHGRAPKWLDSHILMTNDPDAVPTFYRRVLGLG